MTLLGAAIGASTIDPLQERSPMEGLGTGAMIWFIVSGLISLFLGAYVAGRLSGGPRRADGMLHGIVTFSVAETAMLLLLTTTVGALLGGAGSLMSGAMRQGQGQQMSGLRDQIQQAMPQVGSMLPPTGRTETGGPGQLSALAQKDPELAAAMARMATKSDPQVQQQVVSMLTSKHGMSEAEASTMVNQWSQNAQQAKAQLGQEARQAGDKAARGVSKGALWAFIGMVLGLGVAAWGGWVGTASLARYRETPVATTAT
ncbi:MAG TPA: hypothetical protein VN673_19310 [Clostridia bacterium]|nr:hypothetical protein [Clostridia bacterium]